MKTTYQEASEVGEMQGDIINLQNVILDNYKIDPKRCNELLKQLSSISKELDDLEKDFEYLLKEL